MKTYKLFLCIIGLLLCVANPISAQKVKDGFKGFAWGSEFLKMDSSLDLSLEETEGGIAFFSADILILAGVKIESCFLGFYETQFCILLITTKGLSNFNKMLRALTAAFSEPKQENKYIKKYEWRTSKTFRTYDYSRYKETGTLTAISVKIWNEKAEKQKKQAEKNKDDF